MKQYIDEETGALLLRLKKRGIIEKNIDYDNKAIEIIKEIKLFFKKQDTLEKRVENNMKVSEDILSEKQELCLKIYNLIQDDPTMKRSILTFLFEDFGFLKFLDEKHKWYFLNFINRVHGLSQIDTRKERQRKLWKIAHLEGEFHVILKLKKRISKILGLNEFPSTVPEVEWKRIETFQFFNENMGEEDNEV